MHYIDHVVLLTLFFPSLPEPINTFHGIHQNNDEPIRVSYHRNIHYNSVVNPNKATIGVGLGLPALKPGVGTYILSMGFNTEVGNISLWLLHY